MACWPVQVPVWRAAQRLGHSLWSDGLLSGKQDL